jgi:hypothetical protein
MRISSHLVILFLALVPVTCLSEHLYVSKYVPFSDHVITIVGAYQVGGEIWITSHVDQISEIVLPAGEFVEDILEVDLPTVAAKHVESIYLTDARPLYLHREQVGIYDYAVGDGWVKTDTVGYLYLRNYPWVYHAKHGWLKIVEGEPVFTDILDWYEQAPARSGEKQLSYYLFSPVYGWMWKAPFWDGFFGLEHPQN